MSRLASRRLRASAGGGLLALLALSALAPAAHGQCLSLTTLGVPVTQGFDSLAQTGTGLTWTDNSTLPGWYSTRLTYNAGTGSSNTGAQYSFGVAGTNPVTDRALGSVASGGTGNIFYAVCFTNNTGSALSSVDVAYVGEQWRDALPVPAAAHTLTFEYQVAATGTITDANTPATGWTAFAGLDFTGPQTGTAAAALDGNAAANRTALSSSIMVAVPVASELWLRWGDINNASNDHGLAVDDFSLTPQGGPPAMPALSIDDVSLAEGNAGTTTFTFTVSLSAPAGPGGVTFDVATADGTAQDDNPLAEDNDYVAKSLAGQTIPMGSSTYSFDVLVNGDAVVEPNETFFVDVTNVTGATVADGQGQGTIVNDDVAMVFIHDVQGNGAATPIPGATVSVEGVVVGNYQGTTRLQGFFLEEEDADWDADPMTSEGLFVFCSACPTPVAEGQRVRVTGAVSEFFDMTEITASTAGAVVVTDAGNNLAAVTPAAIDLPVAGMVDAFYETLEGMLVTFVDTLTVSEYFELSRFGQVVLYEGGRPRQFTEASAPSVAGLATYLDDLTRRVVLLDDDDNAQNSYLVPPDGQQSVFFPAANGGLSVGTHGVDFFRGGDLVSSLTGVLHWSFAGLSGTDAWRLRPTAANPATFTVANPRPMAAPAVGGAIRAAGMNLLNYFTTIDTTASSSSGPCAPSTTQDCRGADSVAELDRQRERASIVVCGLDADVVGFVELENTTPSDTITDLLGAVNARCGGVNPYDFVDTGGTLGTDAIRVQLIYRTNVLAPVGPPIADLDPVHNRPPTAQTFDVVDAANPAFGERFTVVINHFKSKGCGGAAGGDLDANDGQSCFNATRVAQASRLLAWLSATVLPAAGDPDLLLLGDFNANAMEDPVTTITGGGFTDLETALLGPAAYSYVFDGAIGHLDYAFSSASLTPQVTGVEAWHINADEIPLFDYSDEVKDTGESAFEEKPDGSALVPPRVVFQPASPFRASDHDPILVGLFQVADLSITKVESADPVVAGTSFAYTITVDNAGPDAAASVSWSDTLPPGTTFVSLASPGGWSCMTPAVGAGGTVSCSIATLAVGSAAFTLTVAVDPGVAAGTILGNTADAASTTADPDAGDLSATETTTVAASADLSITKTDSPDPVTAGSNLAYAIDVVNGGPSFAAGASWSDTLPAGTTFVSLSSPGGWSCMTPAVGSGGMVSCSIAALGIGTSSFTLTVAVLPSVAGGTVLSNTAGAASATADPDSGDLSASADTTVAASADLTLALSDSPDPVPPGTVLGYTISVTDNGPSDAAGLTLTTAVPAGTTFAALSAPGWACMTPAVGGTGAVTCTRASLGAGATALLDFDVTVDPMAAPGSTVTASASVAASTPDPAPGDESASVDTTVELSPASLSATKTVSGDFSPGGDVAYTIVVTNAGPGTQIDNAGPELTDVLPAGLILLSASATSGTATATLATNTVTWDGSLPALGSVTITILAQVDFGLAAGTTIANQASFLFDQDGDGTNETAGVSDDPGTAAAGDGTLFVVVLGVVVTPLEIPTLGLGGLLALLALLAAAGLGLLRRG